MNTINDIVYIFVDEAGDMDFSTNGSKYYIFHHTSASSANLQIVDYVSWAIFRKYERGDSGYYDKVKTYILDEELMTKDREINHYEK